MSPNVRHRLALLAKVLVLAEILGIAGTVGVLLGGRAAASRASASSTKIERADTGASPTASEPVVLNVFVVPTGATLIVNGRPLAFPVGDSGVYLPVAAGSQVKLQAAKDGYVPLERTLTAPQAGAKTELLNLTPIDRPAAAERTAPANATAPAPSERAASANERVAARTDRTPTRTRPEKRSKKYERAEKTKRASKPKPKTSTLLLEYEPGSAVVELDDRAVRGRSPMRLEALSPGRHEVVVRAEGYRTMRRTVSLSRGEEAHMSVFLSRRRPPPSKPAAATAPAATAPQRAPAATVPAATDASSLSRRPERTPPAVAPPPKPPAPKATLLHRAFASLARGRDQFRLAVIHVPGRTATPAIRAFQQEIKTKDPIAVRLTLVPYRSVADLTRVMDRGKFDALFIDQGLRRATTSILQVSRAKKVISVGTGAAMARSGASIGIIRGDDGDIQKMYLNARALRVECCRAPAGLLKLAQTVE